MAKQLFAAGPAGGSGGGYFDDSSELPGDDWYLRAVDIDFSNYMWAITSRWENRNPNAPDFGVEHSGAMHGQEGHKHERRCSSTLGPNNWIGRVEAWMAPGPKANPYLSHLKLYDQNGDCVLDGGGSTEGTHFEYNAPAGCEIIGFIGRSGSALDALGVIFRSR